MLKISRQNFSRTIRGEAIELYILDNGKMRVGITNYGGAIVSILVPDQDGQYDDVVLGFDNGNAYCRHTGYLGAIIGRFGNRIAQGRFELDGRHYQLQCNNGSNHLHGGKEGFDRKVWQAKIANHPDSPFLCLSYRSLDGEEGFPGNLDVTVIYSLTAENRLCLDYRAVSDKTTIVNLTNHTYFNLAGHNRGSILKHLLKIDSDFYLPVDHEVLPTGEIRQVAGTPFDFRDFRPIGERIEASDASLTNAGGYDCNFVLHQPEKSDSLPRVCEVVEPESQRMLRVYTDKPGLQFYSGNFLDGTLVGKGGVPYIKHQGFCLETQFFPDSINWPHFPSPRLDPGDVYRFRTEYEFSNRLLE